MTFVAFVWAITLVIAVANNEEVVPRSLGGSPNNFNYAFYVLVLMEHTNMTSGDQETHVCQGALIKDFTILTAGHCLSK